MSSLPSPDHRGQKLYSASLFHGQNLVYHLVYRLLFNLFSADRTMGYSNSCIQQTKIIIYFRHSSHRRSGIPIGGFLINGNSRGKSLNPFHIRFFHLSQKLSGIGRQRLHISALTFSINSVKGQRGFPGTAQPCQNNKLISRNVHIQIFQVMLICTSDFNVLLFCFCHFDKLLFLLIPAYNEPKMYDYISLRFFFSSIILSRSSAAASKFSSAAAACIFF